MLNKIKQTLRISHSKLDDDLNDRIESARQELVRIGVKDSVVYATVLDPLIVEAVKTYVQMKFTDDLNKVEMYKLSWEAQADNLRKTAGYSREVANV